MKNYQLVPAIDPWKLEREGDGIIKDFDSKDEGVKRCTEYLGDQHGSLKIRRKDGTIEEERTYPRFADPAALPG